VNVKIIGFERFAEPKLEQVRRKWKRAPRVVNITPPANLGAV
jgi:hypothetical protein